MLSPKLLDEFRKHWRRLKRKPSVWLFPGSRHHSSDRPITTKVVWQACRNAAQRAGIKNKLHRIPFVIASQPISWNGVRTCASIQMLLGHNDLEQTTIYLHISTSPARDSESTGLLVTEKRVTRRSRLDRPPLEVADLVRAAGTRIHSSEAVHGSPGSTSKCYWLSCAVVLPYSADISMSAPAADIVPSPINSCRNRHCPKCQAGRSRNAGWKNVARTSSDALRACGLHATPSIGPTGSAEQEGRLRSFCFAPVPKHFSKSPVTRNISVPRSALFSVLHTWSQETSNFIRMCIAWYPPGGLSADRTRWIRPRYAFFLPVKVLSRVFRGKFIAALKRAFQDGQLSFHGDLRLLAQPNLCRMAQAMFRKDWVVYSKPPFGRPRLCTPLSGPLHSSA